MKTVLAVYEDGVFKPTDPVDLPERCRVRFEPVPVEEPEKDEGYCDWERFRGVLKDLPVDPLEFQRKLRDEWD